MAVQREKIEISLPPELAEFVRQSPNPSLAVQRSIETCRSVKRILESEYKAKDLPERIGARLEIWEAFVEPWHDPE